MVSLPLQQTIDRVMGIYGMRGPATRADIVEQILNEAPLEYFSLTDNREGHRLLMLKEVKTRMNSLLPKDVNDRLKIHIPEGLAADIDALTSWICISERGGVGALHVMTMKATRANWQANGGLKDFVIELTQASRRLSADIDNMLAHTGAKCLGDLMVEKAA